jgi:hypothetical protein
MEASLMTPWSSRALAVLRAAPVEPRGALAPDAPTLEIDAELFQLTGDRGLPILNGVTLGYPSTIDVATETTRRWDQRHCTWGVGRRTLYLRRETPGGEWVTSGVGSLMGWRAAVETLALEHSYRSWFPPLECMDGRDEYPKRWTKHLATELELAPVAQFEDAYADDSLLDRASTVYARDWASFTRILEACRAIEFTACAEVSFEVTPVDDLEAREQEPGWRPMIEASPPSEGVSFDRRGEDAIRQVRRFQGEVVEILEVSPGSTRCFRAPMRAQGSSARNAFLRQHATMVKLPKPTVRASAAMLEALAPIEALGTFLIEPPRGCRVWVGLWPFDAMPRGSLSAQVDGATTGAGAPDIAVAEWPLYRWGDMEMVAIGGSPDFTLYFCDSTGAIWYCEGPYDIFGFAAGSIATWLEAFADHPGHEDDAPQGPIVEIPTATPWELPEQIGVPLIEARSDARWKIYQSPTYIMWAMLPPRGAPSVSFSARSVDDAVRAVAWAKEHWGTPKVAVTRPSIKDQLTVPIEALGVTVIDGEQGGWHSEAFWERDK